MSCPSDEPSLKDHHYITLILRLGLDQDGELIDGQLVDTIGSLARRFKDREGLTQAVETWFKETARTFGSSNANDKGIAGSKRKSG